jgi:hypothetical protein
VDVPVGVPALQRINELVLGGRARELFDIARDPVLLRHLFRAVRIGERVGSIADYHDLKSGIDPPGLEFLNVLLDVLVHLLSNFFSRQQFCRHGDLLLKIVIRLWLRSPFVSRLSAMITKPVAVT